eukprot:SAG25_NODE_4286_length_847_cov_1.942513_1_plen_34_part_10
MRAQEGAGGGKRALTVKVFVQQIQEVVTIICDDC